MFEADESYLTDQLGEKDKVGLTYINITEEPPTEKPGVATDEDTDEIDDEVEGN